METLVILVVAAGLSAGVVWWAMSPPEARTRRAAARRARPDRSARPLVADDPDGFVLLPGAAPALSDDRPPAAWSLLRLVITIAIVAAVAVAALGLVGLFVKLQLDQYFTGG